MLWFTVWALLVLGTLVGAFFLLRSVWRSAVGLGRELERATLLLEGLEGREVSLAELAPVELMDPEPARARLAAARVARERRRAARAERHQKVYRRWLSFVS